MKNRAIIQKILVSIAAIALIALAVFIFSKGTNKTPENLVVQMQQSKGVYQSEQYHFTLKYPQDWYYQTRQGGELTPYSIFLSPDANFVEYGMQNPKQAYPDQFINVVLVKTNQTADIYATADLTAKNASVIKRTQVQIGGQSGVSFISRLKSKIYLSAYVKYDEYVYEFESVVSSNQIEAMENYFNNLVSSFQFTSMPQPSNRSQDLKDWKIYFNTSYNYEFKYPDNWKRPEQSATTDHATFLRDSMDGGARTFVVVQVYDINGLMSIEDRFKTYHKNDAATYQLAGNLKVDGHDAKRFDEVGGLGEKHVVFQRGSLMFDIYSTINDKLLLDFVAGFKLDSKPYKNTAAGLELMLPPDIPVPDQQLRSDSGVLRFNNGQFGIRYVPTKGMTLDQYHYMDLLPSAYTTWAGKDAVVVKSESGICEVSSCTPPFIAITAENNDRFYTIVFYGDTELSREEQDIVNSVTFQRP